MRRPTLQEFKRWAKDNHDLAYAVCVAKANAEVTRARVNAYIKPIFESYTFVVDPKWSERFGQERITDIKDLYLADLESPEIKAFYADCAAEHKAQGYMDLEAGHCPALIAEHLQIQAEHVLLESGCVLLGLEHPPFDLDLRRRMLDLLLGACLVKENKAA
jgi:hypothetical protein